MSTQSSAEIAAELAKERAAELEAEVKLLHVPMKKWFNGVADERGLKEKFGSFPSFWQDLKKWPHLAAVKKLYSEKDSPATSAAPSSSDASSAPPRKRRNRWGSSADTGAGSGAVAGAEQQQQQQLQQQQQPGSEANGQPPRKRRSRWGAPAGGAAAPVPVPVPGALPAIQLTQQQQRVMAIRSQIVVQDRLLLTVAADAAARDRDPNRSPSPPPQYDVNGKRSNTREVRMRAAIGARKEALMEELVKLNPNLRPAGYQKRQLTRKHYIPVKDFPTYNFIGLIIGPRGRTQKDMERETGCKIAIRGKGSVKSGSRRRDGKASGDETDDLHVLITGSDEAMVDKASALVEKLLRPIDDQKNEHKQKQLRELALINGTLRGDDYCHICGEKGHRQFECPNRERGFAAAAVRCAICGETSHVTRDCPQRNVADSVSAEQQQQLDTEYQSFMHELGEAPKPVAPAASAPAPAPAPAPTLQQGYGAPPTGHAPAGGIEEVDMG
eukprot:g3346.t1